MEIPPADVIAAQSGDPVALAELVRAAWPDAYRIARTVVADHASAEDVAQDACAQLLGALGSLRDPARFTPWFFRIVVNAANGRLRKGGRERLLEPATAAPERLSVDERLDVRHAIDALDGASRAAVVLRYYYDLSSAEIARVTHSTPVTVRWRLMRAHRRLRAVLESRATVALALALAVVLSLNAPAVVAGMQRVIAAFTVAGGRTLPMSVREVNLATARADMPFAIIAPPARAGATVTLREIGSPAAPASESVAFELQPHRPGPPVTIIEARAGGGPHRLYLSVAEPDRGGAPAAPLPAAAVRPSAGAKIALAGTLGDRSFAPLTWVVRGTRIVLLSPPGALSDAQLRAIRSAMSK